MVILIIKTEVNPTENPEKVKIAVANLFAPSFIEFISLMKRRFIVAKIETKEGLMKFYNLLRQERILPASRRVFTRGRSGDNITFYLNKQAAYMSRISFCEPIGESPLGPITVELKSQDSQALIDWLAPLC